MAEYALKTIGDFLLSGKRVPDSACRLLADIAIFGAMATSWPCLLVGVAVWFVQHLDDFSEDAGRMSEEDYDAVHGRVCIHRKTSVDAPPSPDDLRRAWAAARGRGAISAKLLVGTLLSNLEPSVDQSYLRSEDGTIVGRRPGLKGWLRGYCPDLVPHYKALMSYKALADKLRVALGIEEPDTLAGVIDFGEAQFLTIRNEFTLEKTDRRTVEDGIRSLFADFIQEEPGPNSVVSDDNPEAGEKKEVAENDTKTSGFSAVSDSAQLHSDAGPVEMGASGGGGWKQCRPMTMAALEEAVRERLGLCWMRRVGPNQRPA